MSKWDSRGGVLPDLPRSGQGDETRRTTNHDFEPPNLDEPPRGINPQSDLRAVGSDPARMARLRWLRENIAAMAGHGQMPDADDVGLLPPKVMDRTLLACRRAVDAFQAGDQAPARLIAEEAVVEIEALLPKDWEPPSATGPSAEVLASIPRA